MPEGLEETRQDLLQRYASPAINQWLTISDKASAYRVYTSSSYPWSKRLSPRGLIQAILLACPNSLNRLFIDQLKSKQPTPFKA